MLLLYNYVILRYEFISIIGRPIMGGFFGVAAKENCIFDLFFGTDYHSHLGTRRAGMAVYGENGFC